MNCGDCSRRHGHTQGEFTARALQSLTIWPWMELKLARAHVTLPTGCGLMMTLFETGRGWIRCDAAEVAVKPFHDLAGHEVILRRAAPRIPSLR